MTSDFAKKSFSSDINETWYDVRGRWDIHDDMTFKVIRGQDQGQEMTSVLSGLFLINRTQEWQWKFFKISKPSNSDEQDLTSYQTHYRS